MCVCVSVCVWLPLLPDEPLLIGCLAECFITRALSDLTAVSWGKHLCLTVRVCVCVCVCVCVSPEFSDCTKCPRDKDTGASEQIWHHEAFTNPAGKSWQQEKRQRDVCDTLEANSVDFNLENQSFSDVLLFLEFDSSGIVLDQGFN